MTSVLEIAVFVLAFFSVNFDLAACVNFSEAFELNWAPHHIISEGDQIKLTLDNISGCGFESKKKYLFGQASVQIKLIEGDSAGTVTAFYMSSEGTNHDELDFEFLGNVSGEPYLVQTNIYVNGTGNREQRHTLWFDPTLDFHTYSFFWNRHCIVFLVDRIPIRVFTNKEEKGVLFPRKQAMSIRGSVWNADDWATQGGRVKTNWTHAPFVSTFRSFIIDACELLPETDDILAQCGKLSGFWWDKPAFDGLNRHRSHQLKWVRRRHLSNPLAEMEMTAQSLSRANLPSCSPSFLHSKATLSASNLVVPFQSSKNHTAKLKFDRIRLRKQRNLGVICASESETKTATDVTDRWLLEPAGDGDSRHIGFKVQMPDAFEIASREVTVGRLPDKADVVIPVATVSGVHARIQKKGGNLLVTDLDSTNGTFINDQRLRPGVVSKVPPGSFLIFGDIHLAMFRVSKLENVDSTESKPDPEESADNLESNTATEDTSTD
ncbi:hypothetical protein V6N13_119243 [Hibiscus sabdariffa]|uniref:Xyloglucan:xyloglucosyl transferase n=1 Tax=Hibiscus sabdariffa TaxID=183260 RepID=A0ABR2E0M6_9ROSI